MGFIKTYLNNTRKPTGLLGRSMAGFMNIGHTKISRWGLAALPVLSPQDVADLGCGGGKNAARLMELYPAAKLTALDYSQVSVAKTRRLNRKAVEDGRCRVVLGDVSALPFPDHSFDLVTAFETIYFWPGPVQSFREVLRVLRPGGLFMIVNESDGCSPQDSKWTALIEGMRVYTADQLADALTDAGFKAIRIRHNKRKHRLCLLALKP